MSKDQTATTPAAETKAAKFTRLANARVNKALDAIAMIGGLANTGNYEFTADQAEKIGAALNGEVTKLGAKFGAALKGEVVREETGFSL